MLDPQGFAPAVDVVPLAPRGDLLHGDLVYLVDCGFEDGDRFFEQMQRWFAENLPAVRTRVVHWRGHGFESDPGTLAAVASDGAAAILGVGI